MSKLLKFYEKEYKKLLIIPLLLILLAVVQIGYQYNTTGDFLNRGVGLKGGTTITINHVSYSGTEIHDAIIKEFSDADTNIGIFGQDFWLYC